MFYLNDYELILYIYIIIYIYIHPYIHIYMNTYIYIYIHIYIYIYLHAYHICVYPQLYFFQDRQLKSYVYIYIDWFPFSRRLLWLIFPKELLPNSTFHFIYTLSPTSTSHTSSTSSIEPIGPIGTQRLQISCNTPTILFTQELWHNNSCTGVTRELLHRNYSIVLT